MFLYSSSQYPPPTDYLCCLDAAFYDTLQTILEISHVRGQKIAFPSVRHILFEKIKSAAWSVLVIQGMFNSSIDHSFPSRILFHQFSSQLYSEYSKSCLFD